MAQHKMKQKTSLPTGAKQKSNKRIQKSQASQRVRKGGNIYIAPKKAAAVEAAKLSSTVSRFINHRNEQCVRQTADADVGRQPKSAKKSDE